MKVFDTGATGFVGSAVVRELLDAGHKVLGLARSDANAETLKAAGAEAHRGSLEDVESLRCGAAAADGVVHCAFIHDFANFGPAAEKDRVAIEAMGNALASSQRPLIVSSGTLLVARKGELAMEDEPASAVFPRKSEDAAQVLADRGVHVSVVRLPPSVHGDGDHGFVPMLFNLAREKQAAAYVGDGSNRWPAVHRLDAARLYRLALEKAAARANYHAIGDAGVPFREIAEVLGRRLNVPVISKTAEQAAEHFTWMSHFAGVDCPASSAKTEAELGWRAYQPGLIQDIDRPEYFGQ